MTKPNARWAWRAGVILVALAMLAVLVPGTWRLLIGSATGSAVSADRSAPCLPGQAVPIMDSPHVAPTEVVQYNSVPPTSGPHYGFTMTPGIFSSEVPDGLAVHALEHGRVVISYAPETDPRTVESLADMYKRYGADVLVHPYSKLDHGIVLTAWGRIDRLDSYDEDRIVGFIEQLRHRHQHGWAKSPEDECAQATLKRAG